MLALIFQVNALIYFIVICGVPFLFLPLMVVGIFRPLWITVQGALGFAC